VILREAIFDDLSVLTGLAHEAHEASVLSPFKMVEAEMQRTFVVIINSYDGYAKVVEKNGAVVGGLVGAVSQNHFGIRCGQDLFNFSRGGTPELLRDFHRWAKSRGAEFVQITDLSGKARYQKLITSLGYKPGGLNYIGA